MQNLVKYSSMFLRSMYAEGIRRVCTVFERWWMSMRMFDV